MHAAEQELVELADRVGELGRHEPRLDGFFDGAEEVLLARAPGRLDVLGGIADYSGSLVLEQPIREAVRVAAARTVDERVWIASRGPTLRELSFEARELWAACTSLTRARDYFERLPGAERWAAYALGGLAVLGAEQGVRFERGLRVLIDSTVPEGAGVGSSAALEVATLRALGELWQRPLFGIELGLAGQRVENQVVGAPCGVMDQVTSACGETGRLLAIRCQPAQIEGTVALPAGVAIFGIDSGLRHAVLGADYGQVRAAAFMGLRILAERLGARPAVLGPGRVALEGDPLGGYLARLRPSDVTSELLRALPESISGAEFLSQYSGISDPWTRVEPARSYMVRAATLHPITEHERVRELSLRLSGAGSDSELSELGALLFASHDSYSACGLGSEGTDRLVAAVRTAGAAGGFFGAKITGAGSGGTVAILARTDALERVRAVAEAYAAATGRVARVFAGSSPGASSVPVLRKKL
jgi:galactokinase